MENNELLQAIYADLQNVKANVGNLSTDMQGMKTDMQEVKSKVSKLELTIENETNKNIKLLAEGHTSVVDRLDKLENKVEDV